MSRVSFRPLEFDDIQLLRYWRNLEHVRSRMVVRDRIERAAQRAWFERLDALVNKHFIYTFEGADIGCFSITKIDMSEGSFHGGIFCGDSTFLGHWANVWASMQLYNTAFLGMGPTQAYATIVMDNERALRFNSALGFRLIAEEGSYAGRFVLSRGDFQQRSASILKYLERCMSTPPFIPGVV